MTTQTPETVRTAAYLATQERLDARKTTRNVQCNPPNVRCGNRCIPPSWDCRLKGEGPDPHLRAVKTDPLGGLANIERGSRRILRGVAKGSFSEVEGGKRAIIRGAVKIAPGNLQQKKDLQKQLENRTRAIGIGLAVLTGGLGAHALLMKQSPMYRQGLGRSINEAVQTGVNSVLDATPGLASRRSRTRTAAFSGISEAATRETRIPAIGPGALASGLEANSPAALNQLRNTALGSSNVTGNSNLNNALRQVNQQARKDRSTNIYEWDQKHREAFWNTKIKADELDREINVFARPAAEDFIRRQYNITAANSATDIKEALRQKLSEERSSYVQYAKQLGFRTETQAGIELVHKDDRFRFIQTLNRASGLTGSLRRNAKDLADAHVNKLISPTSLSNYSRSIYNKNLEDFDNFYSQVGKAVRSTPGAASLREELVLSGGNKGIPSLSDEQRQFLSALSRTRVNDMARRMRAARLPAGQSTGFARPITGEAHAELVKTAFFHIEVIGQESRRAPDALRQGNARFRGPRTYTISDTLAINAASELAGRPITTANDAFRLLNTQYGFPGATRVRQPGSTTVPRTGLRRQAALSSLAREIMARAGNEGMSLEAAYRAAKREIEQRGDTDDASLELVRTATYLAARADLQEGTRLGKPCGASHIPKSHECRKGQGASPSAEHQSSGAKGRGLAAVAVTAAAGLSIAGVLAHRNHSTLVPGLSQEAIRKLSADQVKAGLDKLPEQFRGPARKLVGDAKLAAAHMALRAQGAQIKAVDVDNNFSTWVTASGTHLSVGSVGDSLLTFGAERKGDIGKFPQYGLGFTVNSSYDAAGGMPSSQAKQLIRTTKAMYKAQLDMLPDDAFLFAVPHKADGKGGKRKSIYEGFGFKAIPGLKGDKLWALKNQGKFTEIPEAQFDYLRNMIRGDRADNTEAKRAA